MEMIRWETPAFCRVSTLSRLSNRPLVHSRFWMPGSGLRSRCPAGVDTRAVPRRCKQHNAPLLPPEYGDPGAATPDRPSPSLRVLPGESYRTGTGHCRRWWGQYSQTPGPPGPAILSDLLLSCSFRLMVCRPDLAAAGIKTEKIPWLPQEAAGVATGPPAWSWPATSYSGAKIEASIKFGHRRKDLLGLQTRIVDDTFLIAGFPVNQGARPEIALLRTKFKELRARIRCGQRNLNRIRIQFAGKTYGFFYSGRRFPPAIRP